MKGLLYGLLLSLLLAVSARAQTVEGDWRGTLKVGAAELRLVLHVTKDEKGGLKATLDSPDQNATGIAVSAISFVEPALKFELRQIGAAFEGEVNADRTAVSGTWTQGGSSIPLEFARASATVEAKKRVTKPSDIDGDWEGVLDADPQRLRLVLHIVTYEDGMTATLDSPDQSAAGLPVTTIARDGEKLRFEMKQLAGSFEGTIDKELATITGTWTQGGGSAPLVLKRAGAAPKEKKAGGNKSR